MLVRPPNKRLTCHHMTMDNFASLFPTPTAGRSTLTSILKSLRTFICRSAGQWRSPCEGLYLCRAHPVPS